MGSTLGEAEPSSGEGSEGKAESAREALTDRISSEKTLGEAERSRARESATCAQRAERAIKSERLKWTRTAVRPQSWCASFSGASANSMCSMGSTWTVHGAR